MKQSLGVNLRTLCIDGDDRKNNKNRARAMIQGPRSYEEFSSRKAIKAARKKLLVVRTHRMVLSASNTKKRLLEGMILL